MKQFLAFVAVIMVLGLVIDHWRLILGLGVAVALVAAAIEFTAKAGKLVREAWEQARLRKRDRSENARMERSRLKTRADAQHELYMKGDSRGVYGEFPPADLDKL
ncbi:MAG: hypothetical protein WAX14_17520 [Rhodococcus sp. (in: high G+C Gram-positive bacteria)]|uniref:hypothetical protein n=1 Tax=Rhodococcus sp. TaxID=1831 RepID=UPI003BB787C9